jgi:hypothetical protein
VSLLGIARPHGRHRGATVRELQQHIAVLQVSRRELKAAMARLAAENHQLQRQLDGAGIELSGARLDLEEAQRENRSLRAALANATTVSISAGVRDITPGDEPTHPDGINVRPLWARLGIVPGSTDPTHIPAA